MSGQPKIMEEEELVGRLKQGDTVAYQYLYDNYAHVLFGIVKRNVAEQTQAEDLLQEAFVKIFRNIGMYDAKRGRLYTWMINITRNLCIDFLRSQANNNSQKNQSLDNSVTQINLNQQTETLTDTIGLKTLVDSLPAQQAEVVRLVYLTGFTQEEAAQQLGIPLGTVKTRIRMAISALREHFKTG